MLFGTLKDEVTRLSSINSILPTTQNIPSCRDNKNKSLQFEGMDSNLQPVICLANHFSPPSFTFLIFEFEVTHLPH